MFENRSRGLTDVCHYLRVQPIQPLIGSIVHPLFRLIQHCVDHSVPPMCPCVALCNEFLICFSRHIQFVPLERTDESIPQEPIGLEGYCQTAETVLERSDTASLGRSLLLQGCDFRVHI